jgi:hypothetical protein
MKFVVRTEAEEYVGLNSGIRNLKCHNQRDQRKTRILHNLTFVNSFLDRYLFNNCFHIYDIFATKRHPSKYDNAPVCG